MLPIFNTHTAVAFIQKTTLISKVLTSSSSPFYLILPSHTLKWTSFVSKTETQIFSSFIMNLLGYLSSLIFRI